MIAAAATTPPGALMAAEVAEQPAVLERLLANRAPIADASASIAAARPRFVLIAARGTSDHAGLYAKYLAEVLMGLPAGLVSPSALTLYGARPDMRDVLFIAVSQSGRSPDLIDSLRAARERGALTLAVTNTTDSPLARAAEIALDVHAGPESAVAATKSYTAELLALYLLIAGDRAAEAAARLPEAAARTLALTDQARLDAAAGRLTFAQRLVLTARGYSYPTAREGALKLIETSYVSAIAFSGADLLHGPLAMIDSSVAVIAVASPGRGGRAMAPVLRRLDEQGAHVLLVGRGERHQATSRGSTSASGDLPIASEGVAEELLPVLEILPLQLLAWRLAIERGIDPDRPRGLSKVTRTR